MDQISFTTVAQVFLELVREQFSGEILIEDTNGHHKLIAELLLEKLHEVSFQYAFMEEEENEEGIHAPRFEYYILSYITLCLHSDYF